VSPRASGVTVDMRQMMSVVERAVDCQGLPLHLQIGLF
jgi:hypothetical protein